MLSWCCDGSICQTCAYIQAFSNQFPPSSYIIIRGSVRVAAMTCTLTLSNHHLHWPSKRAITSAPSLTEQQRNRLNPLPSTSRKLESWNAFADTSILFPNLEVSYTCGERSTIRTHHNQISVREHKHVVHWWDDSLLPFVTQQEFTADAIAVQQDYQHEHVASIIKSRK